MLKFIYLYARKSSSDKQKVNFWIKGNSLVLPALKRRLFTKISSVAYWFLVQILAFVGIRKHSGIPMLTALAEK